MAKFYELETPVAVASDGGIVEYYTKAKKLTLSRPSWFDSQGLRCRGKTVSLSIEPFKEQAEPLIELLNMVIVDLQNAGGEE